MVMHALMGGGTQYATGEIGGAIDFGWRRSDPALLGALVPGKDGSPRRLFEPHSTTENVPMIEGDRVFLWEYAKAGVARLSPAMAAVLGIYNGFPATRWQFTGSCVEGGAFSALITRILLELAVTTDAEAAMMPFTFMAYGQSRYDAYRDSSEGEGSSGDAMAQALATVGAPPITAPGLPKPVFCGPAMCFDRATELKWSSVRNHPAEIKALAKPHLITYGIVTDADEAEAELRRYRPLTWAGDWGGQNTGVLNSDGLLVMPRREVWNHQEAGLGMIRINGKRWWRIHNQWWMPTNDMGVEYVRVPGGNAVSRIIRPGIALPMHGHNPDAGFDGPPGGYYVDDAAMNYQCKTGEVRSIRSVMGYDGDLDFARI